MIWLSTIYFNEERLLRLRRDEELPVVDRFSVVEGEHTFSGNAKPAFLPKDLRTGLLYARMVLLGNDAWQRERFQRNAFWHLYEKEIGDNDVVVVADMDEIPCRSDYATIQAKALQHGIVRLEQRTHYYKLNLICDAVWSWLSTPFAATGQYLKQHAGDLDKIRREPKPGQAVIRAGHQFSYLMTPEEIALKINSFSHTEYAKPPYNDPAHIAAVIANHGQLFDAQASTWRAEPIDETYPATIRENLEAWRDWIA